MSMQSETDLLQRLIEMARRKGAEACDALSVESHALSTTQRLGKSEAVERSESHDLGLRVLVGQRQAIVSSTDRSPEALEALADRAIEMANAASEDPWAGLASSDEIAQTFPEIDMFDPGEPTPARLIELAGAAEDAALAVKGVTNSEDGGAGWSAARITIAASNGFFGSYSRSNHWVRAVMIAGAGQDKQIDYDYSSVTHEADLEDAAAIGRRAGERAVRRLNPRRPGTAVLPVVYDPRVSASLIRHLGSALNGAAIARGASFLQDAMGARVFAPGIAILDDPHRGRGAASKPFDAEGIATAPRAIVEDGCIRSWFLDLATARQLKLESTGHAARSPGGVAVPSITNLHLVPGAATPADLIAGIADGLYVTDLMGMNSGMTVTGDYSRGAGGFWIKNGEIAWPVSDVTIAGRLTEMYANLTPANDLAFKYAVNAPTVRIDGLTVAGPGEGDGNGG